MAFFGFSQVIVLLETPLIRNKIIYQQRVKTSEALTLCILVSGIFMLQNTNLLVQCPATAVMEAALGPERNRLDAHLEIGNVDLWQRFPGLLWAETIPIQRLRCFWAVRFIPLCWLPLGPLKGSCPGTRGVLNNLMSVLEQFRVVIGKWLQVSSQVLWNFKQDITELPGLYQYRNNSSKELLVQEEKYRIFLRV